MLIDKRGKLFGLVNIIDLSAVIILVAMVFGFLWVRSTQGILRKMVRASRPTDVTVTIRGARMKDPNLIKVGDKVFITIRNQPYAPVEVVGYTATRRLVSYADSHDQLKSVEDPSDPLAYDLVVTIRDNGQVTDDGVVLGGNKVKAGIPIELEGFKFRMTGTIVDLTVPKS